VPSSSPLAVAGRRRVRHPPAFLLLVVLAVVGSPGSGAGIEGGKGTKMRVLIVED